MICKAIAGLLIMIITNCAYSQNFSITLSIAWRRTNVSLKDMARVQNVPFLRVTYTNNSEEDIYFKKVLNENTYPSIVFASSLGMDSFNDEEKTMKTILGNRNKESNEEFKVYFGNFDFKTKSWEVLDSATDINTEHEGAIVSDYLFFINRMFSIQEKLDTSGFNDQLRIFNDNNKKVLEFKSALEKLKKLTEDKVTKFSKKFENFQEFISQQDNLDMFCFLEKGTSTIQEVSLLGFQIVGGNYSFSLENLNLNNHILVKSKGSTTGMFKDMKKVKLPSMWNNFRLYEGKFRTNKISLKFD